MMVMVAMLVSPEVILYFQVEVDESTLSPEEQKERKIMKLLLKIKNGTPPMRKVRILPTILIFCQSFLYSVHYVIRQSCS